MILNESYYKSLWEKFEGVKHLTTNFETNGVKLSVKMILKHYHENKPLHINLQNSKDILFIIARHLYIEFANDIYLNYYDLPDNYIIGDKLKRIRDNQYYEIIKADNNIFTLSQILRKTKAEISPCILTGINYDRLTKNFVKVDTGKCISERTIKNFFAFFQNLNNEKSDFPRINFDKKNVFIAKKPLWDYLIEKNKIPSTYLPNPREESHLSEIKSIPALSDCLVYFTPRYEVCYQNILLKGETIKTIIVFDTEADKIGQMLQDKSRYGFNIIVLSNSILPLKNQAIPCWNWFKEEVEIVNSL